MKRLRIDIVLFLTILLLITISFSIVRGASPSIVRNVVTMTAPYDTGNAYSENNDHGKDAQADSIWTTETGMIYARAFASKSSNAWAYSYLQNAFQIVHSSNYKITFSFNYKGLSKIVGLLPPGQDGGAATVKVDLTVRLFERNVGEITSKTVAIADYAENIEKEFVNSTSVVIENIALQENHTYDWQAELRTEAAASPNTIYPVEVEATADFYNTAMGYQAQVDQVLVEDLNPDNIPPTTTASFDGTLGEYGWYISSVVVLLNSTDVGYGVDYINQRTNGEPWTQYSAPIQISSDGTNTVEFYAIDKAGNEENAKSISMKIDKTPPTGQLTVNSNNQYTNSEEVMLSIEAQDGQGSGVSQMRFRNGEDAWSAWKTYATSMPWTLKAGDGSKTVYAQFKDNAGNISPENETFDDIILDTEPATTKATLSGTAGENNWYTSSVTVSLSATDANGVDYINQRTNGGSWNTYTSPIIISSEGTNTIEFYSVDKAGNREATQKSTIKIDGTSPTGEITINGGDSYTSYTVVTLSLTYADTSSGISTVRYSNDGNWDKEPWETPSNKKRLFPNQG